MHHRTGLCFLVVLVATSCQHPTDPTAQRKQQSSQRSPVLGTERSAREQSSSPNRDSAVAFDDQTETERAPAGVAAGDELSTVTGLVLVDGEPPPPTVVELKEDMQRLTGQQTLTIQPWMVGKNKGLAKGLANCVVTLAATDAAQRVAPQPLERAELEKIGPSFVPHVQVVTTDTNLVYRNKNSPCRCFHVQGRHTRANPLVAAGECHGCRGEWIPGTAFDFGADQSGTSRRRSGAWNSASFRRR